MYKKFSIYLSVLVMIMAAGKMTYGSESWIGANGMVETDCGDSTEITGQPNQISPKMEGASIIVDGDPCDWAGIDPLITDLRGDYKAGFDFVNLSVTEDGTYVYFLYEFNGAPMNCTYLVMDTDRNSTTGCQWLGFGVEYGITFFSTGDDGYIGDARDCSWGSEDFPDALIWAVANQYIEAAVPISTLEILTPGLTKFDITTINDRSYIATYVFRCDGDFDGDGDVDGSDLAVFSADFGRTDCSAENPCSGDFDNDTDVEGSDLAVFAANFGRTDQPVGKEKEKAYQKGLGC